MNLNNKLTMTLFILLPLTGHTIFSEVKDENPSRPFITRGQKYLNNNQLDKAKDSFMTAIQMNPADLQGWELYDRAHELIVRKRVSDESAETVIARFPTPKFRLIDADSYREDGLLVIFGTVKNISDKIQKRLVVEISLYDEKSQLLKKISGNSRLGRVGIPSGMSDHFELRISPVPYGFSHYRVRLKPGLITN